MPALDMRSDVVHSRYDLAYAMYRQGFPLTLIQQNCKYADISSVRRAIAGGEKRAKYNEGRVSQRSFGVEIEFNGVHRSQVGEVCQQRFPEIGTNVEDYNHRPARHWKLITDSSVNGSDTGEYGGDGYGNEAVSPILTGQRGFNDLENMLVAIKAAGGRVDRSCGLHVHHDARDMTPHALARMLRLYMTNQSIIDTLLAPSRRATNNNQWCHGWDPEEMRRCWNAVETGASLERFGRYRTINVASFPRYGSIEFRQHQGTLNYSKISNWVRFGQSIVEAAIEVEETPPVFTDLSEMLDFLMEKGHLPKTSRDFLLARPSSYRHNE